MAISIAKRDRGDVDFERSDEEGSKLEDLSRASRGSGADGGMLITHGRMALSLILDEDFLADLHSSTVRHNYVVLYCVKQQVD